MLVAPDIMKDQFIWGLFIRGHLQLSDIFPQVKYSIEELDLLWQVAAYKDVTTIFSQIYSEKD